MRYQLMRPAAVLALCASASLLAGCSGGGNANMTLLETDCIKVVAVDGTVNFGTLVKVGAGSVTYTIKPGCECQVTKLSFKVYQDKNNDGKQDPGEEMFGQSGENLTGQNGFLAGGSAEVLGSQGSIRWEADATIKCGNVVTPLHNYGKF